MQLSDRARRALFGEPAFFLRSRQQCRQCSLTVQCMSSASAECHVEQGGKECVSVFWSAEALPVISPLGTVAVVSSPHQSPRCGV